MKKRYPYLFESRGNADQVKVRVRVLERKRKEEEKEKKKQGDRRGILRNLWYVVGFSISSVLGLEPFKRPPKGTLRSSPWGGAPSRAPTRPSEVFGLALRASQSAKDANFSHSFPTFSYMFLENSHSRNCMVPRGVLLSMDGGMGLHSCIAQVDLERKHVTHELNRAKTQVPRISIQHAVDPAEHSRVSAELRKPGQGFAWGQQWSPSAGHVQGVGSGCDKLGIRAQSSRVLGSLSSRVCRVLVIGVKRATSIIRSLQHLGRFLTSFTLISINPPSFTGSSVTENPENFIEELKRVFDVMHVAESERVELAAYQLKGVARIWFDQWKKNRAEDALVVSWIVFESALMGNFFPRVGSGRDKRQVNIPTTSKIKNACSQHIL
ncbi:hypothetical protein KY290_021570 [Solanum tuberosum]|uniref:Gag-pol polyprotein n=1 Tax=Solanum tuberosum TaxID=4113 RepID=A0ABQ7V404_SOLTU|nr:hypothetical protein KY290_021570 [Solanum tuberosum]